MDSYIIRIYRRDETDPDTVSGTVQGSALKAPAAFSNFAEMLDILRKQETDEKVRKKKYGGKRPAKEGN